MRWFGHGPVMGLDVGSGMLKAVELSRRGGQTVVDRVGIAALPGSAIAPGGLFLDPPAIANTIRKLCRDHHLRRRRAAVALAGDGVVLARLKIERSALHTIDALVHEEVSRLAPFPLADALVDFQILDNFAHSRLADALVVAARRSQVERLQDLLLRAGLSALIVESAACALANVFEWNYDPSPDDITALLHVGAAWMTLCILRGSTPILARDLALVTPTPERVVVELERFLEEMDEVSDDQPLEPRSNQIRRLLLSGGGARMRGLDDLLKARFRAPFEELNPFLKIEFRRTDALSLLVIEHLHCMPVAVGLALQGLSPRGLE